MEQKHGEELHSEQVRAGSRTYFFDVMRASTGARYLKISESRGTEDERHEHHRVMVFEEHAPEFFDGLKNVWAVLFPGKRLGGVDFAEIRKEYPKAYEKWTAEEDERLKSEFQREKSVKVLAERFQRQPGAIESRLAKLGLVSRDKRLA